MYSSSSRQLPFLPGNTFEDPSMKDRHHKKQVFDYRNSLPIVNDFNVPVDQDELLSATEKLAQKLQSSSISPLSPSSDSETGEDGRPKWLSLDRKVLRFYTFFKEGVHESALENNRVRRCVLYYYLEDDTIHVSEPKQDNSGIPQGALIKRHRIPKPGVDREFYLLEDLNIGNEVTLYGKTFRIVGCDRFTKEFLGGIGIDISENDVEDFPQDQYTQGREELKKTMSPFNKLNPIDQDFKRYLEYSFKGRHTNPSKQQQASMQQFLKNDRKVLRFFCCWDDRENLYGDFRHFVLEYYLADDTTKISELNPPNSGRDPFPVFVKRQRIPKPKNSPNEPVTYYEETDLQIGNEIDVFSKKFLLRDCDDYTKEYFNKKYGITDFTPVPDPSRDVEKAATVKTQKVDPPPYNGYGTEEDSLGSWKYLVLKAPKKDVKKYMENDMNHLRFGARMETSAPEDQNRRFIVTFYLADDTVSIFEPTQRNSGIIGGKFLQRQRVKNPDGDYYKASDLFVGAIIFINSHRFLLHETDEHTVKYMESRPQVFAKADLEQVLHRLRENVLLKNSRLKDAFRAVDTDSSGKISLNEFRTVINKLQMNVSEQEVITIMRSFDSDGDGCLNYNEFSECIQPSDFRNPELDGRIVFKTNTDASHKQHLQNAEDESNNAVLEQRVFKMFMTKIENRRLLFQDTFRVLSDRSVDGMIGEPELKKAVCGNMQMNISDEEVAALARRFFPKNKKRISYIDFIKIVEGTSTYNLGK
ncbi:EF-hand domain-containing family member efhc2 [Acrasis kona]|uniref:EF-hand domain-containing family member efhc2 n=1 Tax=Acrasis kona TaxID=1008807 RepID=A0AAW2YWW8_9EUKA